MKSTPETAAAEPAHLTDFILAEVHRQISEEALPAHLATDDH